MITSRFILAASFIILVFTATGLSNGANGFTQPMRSHTFDSSAIKDVRSLSIPVSSEVNEDEPTLNMTSEDAVQDEEDTVQDQKPIPVVQNEKAVIRNVALCSLAAVCASAKLGLLPGPLLPDGSLGKYTDLMIAQDIGSAIFTGTLSYIFVKAITWLASKDYIAPRDSRKIIHTLSAPLFILFWPIFSPAVGARFFAAIVSFINMVKLFIAGTSQGNPLAYAVSRSGDAKEVLGGPFIYVTIINFAILLFWRSSPVGIVAVSTMAAGDGLADLLGRRYGKGNKWWFNDSKSMAGTLAFFVGGSLCTTGLLWLMQQSGCFLLDMPASSFLGGFPVPVERVLAITAVSSFLELVPGVDDNWVVPLSAAVLTTLLFQ